MFKLQNKIFVFTCLLYSLCNKSHSIFKDAFFIQLVAAHPTPHPTLLLVLQEAPLAIPVKKHLEKEGWTPSLISSWSHGDDGNFLGLFSSPLVVGNRREPRGDKICLQDLSNSISSSLFLFMPHN